MRSGKVKKRQVQIDAIYKSRLVGRLIQAVMMHGKKSIAETTVYNALDKLAQEKKEVAGVQKDSAKDSLTMFEQAIKNVMPSQEVRSRRVGGATYQVPVPVKHERSEALAVRWIVNAARSKKGKPMEIKLFEELRDAQVGTGSSVRKRDEVHKMADSNRAFAHFRF